MTDTAPNSPNGRLVAHCVWGRTTTDTSRRGVHANLLGDDEDCSVFLTHDQVTVPAADGCMNLLWDGWQGGYPNEVNRYANNGTTPLYGLMHADARLRALGAVVDGGAILPRLTDGCATACAGLTSMGFWWGIYSGKMGYPTFTPTNGAPRNWLTNLSHSIYDSLTNWRAMFEPALANGCAFIAEDAGGYTLSSEPGALLQTILETAATHTGASLGNASYSGSFTNDHARRFYVEATPPLAITNWAKSFCANYYEWEPHIDDSDYLQPADCDYPPIILCVRCDEDDDQGSKVENIRWLYAKALSLLETHDDIMVAVRYAQMKQLGLDMNLLLSAGGNSGGSVGTSTSSGAYAPVRRGGWGGRHR